MPILHHVPWITENTTRFIWMKQKQQPLKLQKIAVPQLATWGLVQNIDFYVKMPNFKAFKSISHSSKRKKKQQPIPAYQIVTL